MASIRKKEGFTLVELMLVLAIFGIVMGIVFTALTTYQTKSKAQKNILFMNESVKSAIYILTNYIQMAGFGCEYSLDFQNKKINNLYDRVFTPVDNGFNGNDGLTIVEANRFIGYVVDNSSSNFSQCSTGDKVYISVTNTSKINLIDSNLKKYIFIERTPFNSFFELTENPTHVNLSNCPTGTNCYSLKLNNEITTCDNDSVYAVRAISITYDSKDQEIQINENVGGNSYPVLSNVEALQFQYGIDKNGDGNFDDLDNDGNPLDNSFSKENERYLKLVRVFILLRTKDPDPKYKDSNLTYHIANHTINLDTNDSNGINSKYDWHYRRKLIVFDVVPRNIIYGF